MSSSFHSCNPTYSFNFVTGLLDRGTLRARTMVIPDIWIEAGTIKEQYDIAGLNEPHIIAKVLA